MPQTTSNKSARRAKPAKPLFSEERRLPLNNAARDAFLKDLESDKQPTATAKAAAARFKSRRR